MPLITEIFGPGIVSLSLPTIKSMLKDNKDLTPQQRKIMLKEYADIMGIKLHLEDYTAIE